MRFMTLIKSAEHSRVGLPPADLFQDIATLGGQAAQTSVLIETAGLLPTAAGALVRLEGGKISTSKGPFASGHEVVGGYAIFDAPSKQEAIDWAKRLMEPHKEHWGGWEGETEVCQLIQAPASGAVHG